MNKQRACFPLLTALVLLLAALLCAMLSGCTSLEAQPTSEMAEDTEPSTELDDIWLSNNSNPELERLNFELDYTTSYYDYPNELYKDETEEAFHNLTNTRVSDSEWTDLAIGWQIISGEEEYAAFEKTIRDVEAAELEYIHQYGPDDDDFELISITRKTASVEYNEEFFQTNSLLLVDLCAKGAATARFYPENLEVVGDTVSLDVRWDRDNAWVGSSSGQFCLVVIPKGCTTAELNIIHDPG